MRAAHYHSFLTHSLKYDGHAGSAACTQGRTANRAAAAPELIVSGDYQTHAGASYWMPQGNAGAVGIELLHINFQLAVAG